VPYGRRAKLTEDMPVKMSLEPYYHSQYQDAEDYDVIFSAINHPKVGITILYRSTVSAYGAFFFSRSVKKKAHWA